MDKANQTEKKNEDEKEIEKLKKENEKLKQMLKWKRKELLLNLHNDITEMLKNLYMKI